MKFPLQTEKPILLYPSLAAMIGLEESVLVAILSEVSTNLPTQQRNGFEWVSLDVDAVRRALPFWNDVDIRRLSNSLRDRGVLLIASAPFGDSHHFKFAFNTRTSEQIHNKRYPVAANERPSSPPDKAPSAGFVKEPSAAQQLGKEPSAAQQLGKEPSAYPGREPSAYPGKEPSAQRVREPSAQQLGKEPSAYSGKEPSAYPGKEPSAYPGKEPSAYPGREPSAYPGKEPSAQLGREPSAYPGKEPSAQPDRAPSAPLGRAPLASVAYDALGPARKNYIAPNWQPDDMTLGKLAQHNIPSGFAYDQIPEFVTYWRESRETARSWGAKFVQHVIYQWRHFEAKRNRQEKSSPIHRHWRPSVDAMEVMTQHMGIPQGFIDDTIPEFVLYWRERDEAKQTWNSLFIGHVRVQWNRYRASQESSTDPKPIPANWRPSADVFDILRLANIDLTFAESLVAEFVIYWRDSNQLHTSWNTRFLQYAKRQWAHRLAHKAEAQSTREMSLEQELTDRSWAT